MWHSQLRLVASLWPVCLAHPGTHGLHLVLLARDTALGIWRQLTLDLGLKHHLTALQLHHTLMVSGAILEEVQVPAQQSDFPLHVHRHQCGALNTLHTRAGACSPDHLFQLPEPGGVILVVEAGQEDEGGGRALVLSRVSIT